MKEELKQKFEDFSIQLSRFIDLSGRLVSWLVVFMVLATFFVVVMRYLFDTGWIAVQESISYMHSIVFLVGAAYTLNHNEHVRVDIFYARMSSKKQAWVELIGHLFMLIPIMVFIIWISYPYIVSAWSIKESSPEAGGLPGVYLLKSLILLMAVLLIVQAVALIIRAMLEIGGNKPVIQPKQAELGGID